MKALSKIHIILALLAFIFGSKLKGQLDVRPEIVPYMLEPIDYDPDYRLEVGIALLHPFTIESMIYDIQREQTLEIICERINFELINPEQAGKIFSVDGNLYVLIRVPHTGASWNYNRDRE